MRAFPSTLLAACVAFGCSENQVASPADGTGGGAGAPFGAGGALASGGGVPGGGGIAPGTGGAATGGGSSAGGAAPAAGGSPGGAPAGGTAGTDAGIPRDGSADGDSGTPVPPPTPVGCVTDVTAGAHHFDCDGVGYDLTVPDACLTTACGLIVDVHGGTMSGPMEDKNTNLAALGRRYGYVVITPSAPFGLWNAATDDTKVLAFLTATRDAFHVDPRRIHMTGMSQGGYMSWRFLCKHTDLFGSVAPAAAAGAAAISAEVGCTFTGSDVPTGEMDILYIHGTDDALVNYANAVTLRDAVIAHYGMGAGQPVAGDSTYTRTRYATPSGRVFEFIEHRYITDSNVLGLAIRGHCFPGSQDQTITLPGQLMSFGCKPPTSFTWGEEVIKFFVAHPKP